MTVEVITRLLPFLLVFGGIILSIGVFRIQASNAFVDHRKTALRNQLRDFITGSPYLLVVIQRLGKRRELLDEEADLFERIHPAYAVVVREVHSIRSRATQRIQILEVAFVLWITLFVGLVLYSTPSSELVQVLPFVLSVALFALLGIYVVVRTLQPGVSRSQLPLLRQFINNARDELQMYLASHAPAAETKPSSERNPVPPAGLMAYDETPGQRGAVSLADLWQVQEAMLQSYRALFIPTECILLVGSAILVAEAHLLVALPLIALGVLILPIWRGVCKARARGVVFVHWLIGQVESGQPVDQPYSSFREFQDTLTHGEIDVLSDHRFQALSRTMTGRRLDKTVPLLFAGAWLLLLLVSWFF